MKKNKNIAIKLRKSGKSYNEISKITSIPKSTLSNWFNGVKWSEKIKQRLSKISADNARKRMIAISHKKRKIRQSDYKQKRKIAKQEFNKFKNKRLFIAGLMVYWGEGDSKLANGIIRVCNSDPLMIKLFYKFIKTYLSEISQKTRMYLVLYPDLNEKKCKSFWSLKVGLPENKFFKSSFIKGKHPTKRLSFGIGTITITSRAYKEKMLTWINLIKKEDISRV